MTVRKRILLGLAILAPAAAWYLLQQGAGGLEYVDCRAPAPPLGPILGVTGLLICLAAGWIGWRRLKAQSGEDRFLPMVAVGVAMIFALACLATTAAMLVIPPCAR